MKVKTFMNAHEFPKKYEENKLPSLTVPDQTMSIREIMTRYARGLPLETRTPIYEGEEDELGGIDPRRLDLAERQELKEQAEAELEIINERQKQHQIKKSNDEKSEREFREKQASERRDEERKKSGKMVSNVSRPQGEETNDNAPA